MLNLLRKTAQVTYVPGTPGQQYRAAYCTTTYVEGSLYSGTLGPLPAFPSGYEYYPPTVDAFGQQTPGGYYPRVPRGYQGVSYPSQVSSGASGSGYTSYSEEVCYPEVPYIPAVPSRIDTRDLVGWNAGARSISALVAGQYAQFTVAGNTAGVLVGLADGADFHTYSHATHAVLVQGDTVSVVESGTTKYTWGSPAPVVGVYQIRTTPAGAVDYFVDGALLYRSAEPLPAGAHHLDATLYTTSDTVYDPSFGTVAAVAVTMMSDGPGLVTALDRTVRMLSDAVVVLRPKVNGQRRSASRMLSAPRVVGYAAVTQGRPVSMISDPRFVAKRLRTLLAGVMPAPVGVFADAAAATFRGAVPRLAGDFLVGPPVTIDVGGFSAACPPPTSNMVLLSGGLLELDAAMPSPRGAFFSDENTMVMDGAFSLAPRWSGWFDQTARGQVEEAEVNVLFGYALPDFAVFVTVYDGVEFGMEATFTAVINDGALDALTVSASAELGRIIELIAREELLVSNNTSFVDALIAQYAVNTESAALSIYDQFGFTGFTRHGTDTYGYRSDGVYLIGGDTDAGAAIRGALDFGTLDFGVSTLKHIPDVFVGTSSDGTLYVRMTADDGGPMTYRVVGDSVTRRGRLSKGLRGRQWRVQLEVVDAGSTELYDVEFNVELAGRRQARRV